MRAQAPSHRASPVGQGSRHDVLAPMRARKASSTHTPPPRVRNWQDVPASQSAQAAQGAPQYASPPITIDSAGGHSAEQPTATAKSTEGSDRSVTKASVHGSKATGVFRGGAAPVDSVGAVGYRGQHEAERVTLLLLTLCARLPGCGSDPGASGYCRDFYGGAFGDPGTVASVGGLPYRGDPFAERTFADCAEVAHGSPPSAENATTFHQLRLQLVAALEGLGSADPPPDAARRSA